MPRRLHANAIIPRGLVIDHVEVGDGLNITTIEERRGKRTLAKGIRLHH